MSNILEKQYALNDIRVKKVSSGEVIIHFNNQNINDFVISNDKDVDLLKLQNVTVAEIRNSNIKFLLEKESLIILN